MVETSIHQVKKPEPIEKDSRGTKIEANPRIAFNKSGSIVLGNIVEIKKNEFKVARPGVTPKQWWNLNFKMLVIDEQGDLSTLKNPNSFVII